MGGGGSAAPTYFILEKLMNAEKVVFFDGNIKKCCRCKLIKPKEEFNPNRTVKNGLQGYCKSCCKIKSKSWYIKNEDRRKVVGMAWRQTENGLKSGRERNWSGAGIKNADGSAFRLHDYEVLLAQQNFKCAICDSDNPKRKHQSWLVDHDHKTGIARWVLCMHCNMMLGHTKDNPDLLEKAARMLREKRGY
jgi:hypothetical protein